MLNYRNNAHGELVTRDKDEGFQDKVLYCRNNVHGELVFRMEAQGLKSSKSLIVEIMPMGS